jgi:hypothetical protein
MITAVVMLALAYLLFLPFWAHYVAPLRQWGWTTQEFAPVGDVLTIFGVLLVAALPALAGTLGVAVRERRLLSGFALALGLLLAALAGWARTPACAVFLGCAVVAAIAWASTDSAPVRTGALLVAAAGAIGATTEVVFVWDRMNTVFKYYLQMWLLLGCGGAVLAWSALRGARHRTALVLPLAAVVAGGLFTSVTGAIGHVRQPRAESPVPSLDGLAHLERTSPAELAAYRWSAREIPGIPVMVEAQGPSYQAFSRVSMNTGLPTVLGWEYHQFQQGRSREAIDARARDVREIYTSADAARVAALLQRYHVDFVFVGPLEQRTYGAAVTERLASSALVEPVFKSGPVTIFARPGRATSVKTWLEKAAPAPPTIDPLSPLREPRGIAVARDGTMVVADFGNRRIQRLGADAKPIGAFGTVGEGPAQFRDPAGVAVAADGTVWVADTWNHRIQAFTPEGRQVMEWTGGLYGPRGIALGKDGVVFLTDSGNGRVLAVSPDGTSRTVAGRDLLEHPVGIAVDRDGEVYVADSGHRRIVVLAPDGRVIRAWAIEGWQPGSRMEPYVSIGPDDAVWVTDPPNGRVLLFSREGEALGTAVAEAPLALPLGIAVTDGSSAVVTDAAKNAVVRVTRPDAPARARSQRRP